jgi:hypothetical protein
MLPLALELGDRLLLVDRCIVVRELREHVGWHTEAISPLPGFEGIPYGLTYHVDICSWKPFWIKEWR